MKIILDTAECIACGTCEVLCGKFFAMKDDTMMSLVGGKKTGNKEELETEGSDCVKEAVDNCPVQCIQVK